MATINKYNFLRWSKVGDLTTDIVMPKPYRIDQSGYMPVLVPGEVTTFYLNCNISQDFVYTLRILKNGIDVSGDLVTLSKAIQDISFEIYGSFITPTLSKGQYILGIYLNGELVLTSNPVMVLPNDYEKKTALVKFRHDRALFGVNYDLVPDFYQQFRIHISEVDRQYEYNKDQYRSEISGNLRNFYSTSDRFVKFETYYFDDGAHEAIAAMVDHDEVFINGERFVFKSGYKTDTDLKSAISKGEFEMWEWDYSSDNRNDNTNEVIFDKEMPAPPLVTSLLLVDDVSTYGANDGRILAEISGGYAPLTIEWKKNNVVIAQDQDVLENLGPGSYTLRVTDSKGYVSVQYITIIEPSQRNWEILYTDIFNNWSAGLPVGWESTNEAISQFSQMEGLAFTWDNVNYGELSKRLSGRGGPYLMKVIIDEFNKTSTSRIDPKFMNLTNAVIFYASAMQKGRKLREFVNADNFLEFIFKLTFSEIPFAKISSITIYQEAPSIFYNVQKSGIFTKNDCAFDKKGTDVEYIVAAGMYSSEESQIAADALAQDDVDTNGQSHANTNGACVDRALLFLTCIANGKTATFEFICSDPSFNFTVYEDVNSYRILEGVPYTITVTGNFTMCGMTTAGSFTPGQTKSNIVFNSGPININLY